MRVFTGSLIEKLFWTAIFVMILAASYFFIGIGYYAATYEPVSCIQFNSGEECEGPPGGTPDRCITNDVLPDE